ncbi:hypothetical protein DFS34DRAFT_645891 [Phlyctochytrium arcticum]|nr:hypothetical protein DFS34DRAFT_645891 [Phlyctochytrium arcticum]
MITTSFFLSALIVAAQAQGFNPAQSIKNIQQVERDAPTTLRRRENQQCVRTGHLRITDSNNNPFGYVDSKTNVFGEFGQTTNFNDRLLVSYTPSPDGGPINIMHTNSDISNAFPYLAGVVGYSSGNDLMSGSYNYAYFAGAQEATLKNTPAQIGLGNSFIAATGVPKGGETQIWAISNTGALSAQWVNTDGGNPATYTMFIGSDDVLTLTGDPAVSKATFGSSVQSVALTFVQTSDNGLCPCVDNDRLCVDKKQYKVCSNNVFYTMPCPIGTMCAGNGACETDPSYCPTNGAKRCGAGQAYEIWQYPKQTTDGPTFSKVFMVMEYCEQSLRGVSPGIGRKNIMHQILDGIAYCQSNRALHRDLKPDNILLVYHDAPGLDTSKISPIFGQAELGPFPINPIPQRYATSTSYSLPKNNLHYLMIASNS